MKKIYDYIQDGYKLDYNDDPNDNYSNLYKGNDIIWVRPSVAKKFLDTYKNKVHIERGARKYLYSAAIDYLTLHT